MSTAQRVKSWTDPPKPMPDDFENFVPWACYQMAIEDKVVVARITQSEYVSIKSSSAKPKKQKAPTHMDVESTRSTRSSDVLIASNFPETAEDLKICIDAIYDTSQNLIQIKFIKNKTLPRKVFKIISLIIRFQKQLTSLVINSGLTCGIVHDIAMFLPLSQITEVCLDHTQVKEANYDILLEHGSLKHFSLARCKINDAVVKNLASKLYYQQKAAKTLIALNLASNSITDEGVQYLADALRTNRQLSYLNLSDNLITDKGANCLFDILLEFPLTNLEELSRKKRHMAYLNRKLELIVKMSKEMRAGEIERKVSRKKPGKSVPAMTRKKSIDDKDHFDGTTHMRSIGNIELLFTDRATNIVEDLIGPFLDPFDEASTFVDHNKRYCYGNNILSYLNVAYNDLTYISIKKLRYVITKQQMNGRKPKGLLNVRLEGNYMPNSCKELTDIDDLLNTGLSDIRRPSFNKKRASKIKV